MWKSGHGGAANAGIQIMSFYKIVSSLAVYIRARPHKLRQCICVDIYGRLCG